MYAELVPCTTKLEDMKFKPRGFIDILQLVNVLTTFTQELSYPDHPSLYTMKVPHMLIPPYLILAYQFWVFVMGSRLV